MEKKKALIFAGTTEGRRLSEYLAESGVQVCASTATEYGQSLLPKAFPNLTALCGRMTEEEMRAHMEKLKPDYVIDATHPYAEEVTEHIRRACETCGRRYIRLVRDSSRTQKTAVYVDSTEEAAEYLKTVEGNILVTTGSKELEKYTVIPDYKERIYARVLSVREAVEKCESLGIRGRNLICMQGPFSVEMNRALIREYHISVLVTKESGEAGGYQQKCEAAADCGVKLVVIGRPKKENGYSYKEMIKFLNKEFNINRKQKVCIVGIGPGDESFYTKEAFRVCREADVLIGAERMIKSAALEGQATYVSYKPEEMLTFMKAHPEYENFAAVMSGDTGFYSGAAALAEILRSEERIETRMIPGVSSVSYLCAKLGVQWEDAFLVSIHGRETNLISVIRKNRKVIALTGGGRDIQNVCREMTYMGYGNLKVCIGENLSYENEKILEGTAEDYCGYEGGKLSVLYIENPDGGSAVTVHGIPDEGFLRGQAPMTKEEVRGVSLSKMRIRRDSVIFDVGAGTGSIAVEAALQAEQGHVYAVEKKEEAAALIRENARKMKAGNLTVTEGEAPQALTGLPAPDIVFIGGSEGKLEAVLQAVIAKNPKVRVVINAITLETVAEAIRCVRHIAKTEEEVLQLSVAKSRNIGDYHMMTGQNPVFVISFTCMEKRCE